MGAELTEGGFASPYSTGGGVVLEHAHGAVLLADLLQGHPVSGLGDEITPREVRFQQAATSAVDDLVVLGDCPTATRTIYIGVRRAPTIAPSSSSFVDLLVDYLRMVVDRQAGLESDGERLGLAVSAPHTGANEVAQLAFLARRQPDAAAFRTFIAAPKATNAKVRRRLVHLDAAVATAASRGGGQLSGGTDSSALTWRLLKALRVIELRLEGDSPADATGVVGRLVPLAGDAARATALWRRLLELAAGYAQAASTCSPGTSPHS